MTWTNLFQSNSTIGNYSSQWITWGSMRACQMSKHDPFTSIIIVSSGLTFFNPILYVKIVNPTLIFFLYKPLEELQFLTRWRLENCCRMEDGEDTQYLLAAETPIQSAQIISDKSSFILYRYMMADPERCHEIYISLNPISFHSLSVAVESLLLISNAAIVTISRWDKCCETNYETNAMLSNSVRRTDHASLGYVQSW